VFNSVDGCAQPLTKDNKTIDFYPEKGICVISFYDKKVKEFHRLSVFGFTDVMLNTVKSENHFPMED